MLPGREGYPVHSAAAGRGNKGITSDRNSEGICIHHRTERARYVRYAPASSTLDVKLVEKERREKKWTKKVLQRLEEEFPFPTHDNRGIWARYLPHTRQVIEFQKDADNGEAGRDLLFNVAESFYVRGTYREAEQRHRQTLELREKAFGKEDPDTLESMDNLATFLDKREKDEGAKKML